MFENTFFISLIGFLVVLTPLVFFHELGHYLAAIKNGVVVEQFSVGFGPELFGFTDKNNTRWKVCLIPFGGYVKMKGELLVNDKNYQNYNDNKGYFNNASLLSRLLIVFSGPLANILLGVLIITTLYSFHGRYEVKPEVNKVVKNSPAERAGVIPNDLILSINNKKVSNFEDIKKIVSENKKQLSFEILRNKQILFFNIKPEILDVKDLDAKSFKIGIIASSPILVKHDLISSIYYGLKDTLFLTYEWIKGFFKLISFKIDKKDVAGPIGIAKISGDAISLGLPNFLFLMALLSINLGLINLLPIPALDGGYILMYFIEFALGRPINQKIQLKLIQIGVFLLIFLMLISTFIDIQKLFV